MDKLKKLDLFPKVNDDFYQRTSSGGVITIGASLIMAALFFSELGKAAPAAMCWSVLGLSLLAWTRPSRCAASRASRVELEVLFNIEGNQAGPKQRLQTNALTALAPLQGII